MPWIKIKYFANKDGRSLGHYAHCQDRRHFRDLLERWEINPRDIESLEIDGQPFDPMKLLKRGGTL